MKVFLDADVIIDVATQRLPFYNDSSKILSLIERGDFTGATSPVVLVNLFYIARKLLDIKAAKDYIKKLLTLLEIISVSKSEVQEAAESDFSDFEDAVQNFSAISASVDVIITRNTKDFKNSTIKVLTPQDFLSTFYKTMKNN